MTLYLLSQLCALVALTFGVRAYLHPHDKMLKIYIGCAAIGMAAHFACLGAWVGAALSVVGAARYISAGYSKSVWLYYGFLALGLALGLWRYHTIADTLPLMAHILACYALFNLEGRNLRQTMLMVTGLWLTFNAVNYSVIGMLLEGFYLVTNIFNLVRTRCKNLAT
jgi:Bacterial inner membrane protein